MRVPATRTLENALRRAGFTSIHAMNYNPLVNDVPQIATKLSDRVEMIRIPERPSERELESAARRAALDIERFVRAHPTQWFHFAKS